MLLILPIHKYTFLDIGVQNKYVFVFVNSTILSKKEYAENWTNTKNLTKYI